MMETDKSVIKQIKEMMGSQDLSIETLRSSEKLLDSMNY